MRWAVRADPLTTRRGARWLLLVAVLAPVLGCSSASGGAVQPVGTATSSTSTSASTTTSTPQSPSRAGTSAATSAPAPASTSASLRARTSSRTSSTKQPAAPPLAPLPSQTRQTQPAQPLTATATFGTGVTVRLVRATAVIVTGRGPGEVSGPGVAYLLELRNGTGSSIDLGSAVVTATYGPAGAPASDSAGPPNRPWAGRVAPLAAVTGTYVFLVPQQQRDTVSLSISYDPRRPVVVLSAGRR